MCSRLLPDAPRLLYRIVAEHPQELALCSPTVSMMSGVKIGSETTSTSASGVSEDYDNICQGEGFGHSHVLPPPL